MFPDLASETCSNTRKGTSDEAVTDPVAGKNYKTNLHRTGNLLPTVYRRLRHVRPAGMASVNDPIRHDGHLRHRQRHAVLRDSLMRRAFLAD